MPFPESASGAAKAFSWKTYSVQRGSKEPLLNFILQGLHLRGCRILSTSSSAAAPFYIVFENPAGQRQATARTRHGAASSLRTDRHNASIEDGRARMGSRAEIQRLVGNAVPSALAEILADEIRKQLLSGEVDLSARSLVPTKRADTPAPDNPSPVRKKYRHLVGEHKAHPGTGKGRGARRRFSRVA